MYYRILRSFTTMSIIFYVPALLLVYAFLGEECGILFTGSGEAKLVLTKNEFFYAFLISFFLFQVLMYVYKKSSTDKGKETNSIMFIWMQGMILAINLFFILMIVFIGFANNAVDYSFSSVTFIGYTGSAIILIWILAFPIFLFMKKSPKN